MNKDNIITAILLIIICFVATGLFMLSQVELPKKEIKKDKWDNDIIDITGVDNKTINNTTAKMTVDIKPGINSYNITIENKGTIKSYIESYIITPSIYNENIYYDLNITLGEEITPKDTKTYKIIIDNNTKKTYKDVSLTITINMTSKIIDKQITLSTIKYNNEFFTKTNNTFKYELSDNNYIVFGDKCYQIIEIINNDILAIYSKEYNKTCTNKKLTMKTEYDNIYKIFEEVSNTGNIIKGYSYTHKDLIHLYDFEINNNTSKITLTSSIFSNTLDWTLTSTETEALANDNNYYSKQEKLNITPVIRIKDIYTLTGNGTTKDPYIIKKYLNEMGETYG